MNTYEKNTGAWGGLILTSSSIIIVTAYAPSRRRRPFRHKLKHAIA